MFDFPRLFPQFKTNKILRFFLRVLLANRGNCFPKIPYPLPSTVYNFYFIYWHKRLSHFALKNSTVFNFVKLAQDWTTFAPGMFAFTVPKVEVLETVRIRRFAYEKWVYFFEIFYVDGEEEIVMRRSGFIFFCPIDNFQEFFKVQSKFNPLTAP
jgi:hypothetical protein